MRGEIEGPNISFLVLHH